MRVRAERPAWYLSVVGGALYVSAHILECILLVKEYVFYTLCLSQKASASSAAMVSDYIGYLEKGQIPPKVQC